MVAILFSGATTRTSDVSGHSLVSKLLQEGFARFFGQFLFERSHFLFQLSNKVHLEEDPLLPKYSSRCRSPPWLSFFKL
ncbi:uncharacterized protein [Gossypium hirsutum]|uniref:Uncharacterized protein isoform X3 n=1 Tax=Gossypium hirsutum TaxID=3635 RepID=A0ABM3C2W6_GOSHI|nr:uncharacterized protein LOC107960052 isoform X3 [Gossypium hirsutum]